MMDVEICGVRLKNPVIAASGTYGFGEEYSNYYQPSVLGGICTKGLTLEPREGNDGRRVHETPSGMLNSVGLQNPGIDCFIRDILPMMREFDTAIIANVGGSCMEDYIEAVERLNKSDIDMIELNISCPNVKSGGMAFGIRASVAYEMVREVKMHCLKPLMVKLSPNAEDIVKMAVECVRAGADALSLINTFKAMAVDIKSRRAIFDNVYAGLSGPAIMPIALRMVHEVCKHVNVPVVGLGGISTAEDAIAFIMAGATAVQIGTSNFANPFVPVEIIGGLELFMRENQIKNLDEIRGRI